MTNPAGAWIRDRLNPRGLARRRDYGRHDVLINSIKDALQDAAGG